MGNLLADLVLIVHFGIVLFITGGLALVWAGAAAGWAWVRARRFRLLHLGAILFVAAEALLGIACPLTVWEDALRGSGAAPGFIQRWVHRILFWDLPPWIFTAAYVAFAAAVALTWLLVPPRPARRR